MKKKIIALLCIAVLICATSVPALAAPADGSYSVSVSLSGGTGKVSLVSPASVSISGGSAKITLVFTSDKFDKLWYGGTEYDFSGSGNSTFTIPISESVFGNSIGISAETLAMSSPHTIEYTVSIGSLPSSAYPSGGTSSSGGSSSSGSTTAAGESSSVASDETTTEEITEADSVNKETTLSSMKEDISKVYIAVDKSALTDGISESDLVNINGIYYICEQKLVDKAAELGQAITITDTAGNHISINKNGRISSDTGKMVTEIFDDDVISAATGGLSTGAIIGIALGSVVLIAAIAAVVIFLNRKKDKGTKAS